MRIITRAEWGARLPKLVAKTSVAELYLHHSVGSGTVDKDGDGDKGDDYMRSMQNFHMDSRGWSDIAYNHAYDPDGGEFYEGRGFGVRPGAQKNHNTGTHALVVMGDYRTKPVTDRMIEDLAGFYTWAIAEGHLPDVTVRGHRDAPNQETTCPGVNLYAALPAINELTQEDTMPLTSDDVEAIWSAKFGKGDNIKLAGHLLAEAARDAAIARALAEKQANTGRTLSQSDIDAVIAEHAESFGLIQRDE